VSLPVSDNTSRSHRSLTQVACTCVVTSDSTIARILNDVLSLQKIEDGAFELHFVKFPLSAILEPVANSFRAAAAAKGLDLTVSCQHLGKLKEGSVAFWDPTSAHGTRGDVSADTVLLEGDLYRLHQVLSNYVSNGMYA